MISLAHAYLRAPKGGTLVIARGAAIKTIPTLDHFTIFLAVRGLDRRDAAGDLEDRHAQIREPQLYHDLDEQDVPKHYLTWMATRITGSKSPS